MLSDEEQQECQETLRLFLAAGKAQEDEEGELVFKTEFAEKFQRSIIANSLMSRAERFLSMAGGSTLNATFRIPCISVTPVDQSLAEKACVAAAKACSIFPFSMYFYDFGCILQRIGKEGEARTAFTQFLGKIEVDQADSAMQPWLGSRNIEACVQWARKLV